MISIHNGACKLRLHWPAVEPALWSLRYMPRTFEAGVCWRCLLPSFDKVAQGRQAAASM